MRHRASLLVTVLEHADAHMCPTSRTLVPVVDNISESKCDRGQAVCLPRHGVVWDRGV